MTIFEFEKKTERLKEFTKKIETIHNVLMVYLYGWYILGKVPASSIILTEWEKFATLYKEYYGELATIDISDLEISPRQRRAIEDYFGLDFEYLRRLTQEIFKQHVKDMKEAFGDFTEIVPELADKIKALK